MSKRGVGEQVLEMRGLGKASVAVPEAGKTARSRVSWWAAWVLSGVPGWPVRR